MFKQGDFVKVKANTTLDTGDVVSNWAGKIKAVYPEHKSCLIALDAPTINAIDDAYLMVSVDEGSDPAKYGFLFTELELSARRDTDKEAKKALADLNMRILALGEEDDEQQQEDLKIKWIEVFCKSKHFDSLSDYQKEHAGFIIDTFMGYMYNYEYVTPAEWDTDNLMEVCLDIIPRKITAEIALFENYGDVLISFLSFLRDETYINNGNELIEAVKSIKDEIPLAAGDSSRWGMAKSMMMSAQDKGVDLDDELALEQFFMSQSLGMIPDEIETKVIPLKADPYKDIGRNQKITVKYTDGKLVENVKFKKVASDLRSGLCEIVGG